MPYSACSRTRTGGMTGSKPCPRSFSSAQRTSASSSITRSPLQVGEARAREPRAALHVDHRSPASSRWSRPARRPRRPRAARCPRRGAAGSGRFGSAASVASSCASTGSAPRRAPCRAPRLAHRGDRLSASSPRAAPAIAWLASFCCARTPSSSGISSRRRASSSRTASTGLGGAAAGQRLARGAGVARTA